MPTIIPEEETPDLFEPVPGPAPEQLELFTEESQQVATTGHDCPAPVTD
ncbi:hypothetical protein ACF8LD_12885 [Pseudomonas sp. zbq_5]